MTTDPLHLEDLYVGQRFESATHTMTAAEIKAFASQFDPQPFHLDEALAATSVFGGLAASGWHTAAISMRLMVDQHLFADGQVGAGCELAWPRPVRAGDTLRVVSEVLEVVPSASRPDRGRVRMRSLTLNQDDAIVQEMTARLLVFRRRA